MDDEGGARCGLDAIGLQCCQITCRVALRPSSGVGQALFRRSALAIDEDHRHHRRDSHRLHLYGARPGAAPAPESEDDMTPRRCEPQIRQENAGASPVGCTVVAVDEKAHVTIAQHVRNPWSADNRARTDRNVAIEPGGAGNTRPHGPQPGARLSNHVDGADTSWQRRGERISAGVVDPPALQHHTNRPTFRRASALDVPQGDPGSRRRHWDSMCLQKTRRMTQPRAAGLTIGEWRRHRVGLEHALAVGAAKIDQVVEHRMPQHRERRTTVVPHQRVRSFMSSANVHPHRRTGR